MGLTSENEESGDSACRFSHHDQDCEVVCVVGVPSIFFFCIAHGLQTLLALRSRFSTSPSFFLVCAATSKRFPLLFCCYFLFRRILPSRAFARPSALSAPPWASLLSRWSSTTWKVVKTSSPPRTSPTTSLSPSFHLFLRLLPGVIAGCGCCRCLPSPLLCHVWLL